MYVNKDMLKRHLKYFFPLVVFFCGLVFSSQSAVAQVGTQKKITHPKVELRGKIEETEDYFGRKRFLGKIINKEKVRIDYIKIDFTLRNREGLIIAEKSEYITAKKHTFYDFQVSTSSLDPGKIGSFNVIVNVPADSVYSFSHKISGKHYPYK